MIKLETIEIIREVLLGIMAFVPSIGFVGFFKAWMAQKVGDSTAAENGFLTLNPFTHVDPLGFSLMIFSHIGFTKGIPFNLSNLKRPYLNLKIFLLKFSPSIGHLILAFISILAFKLMCHYAVYLFPLTSVSPLFITFLYVIKTFIFFNLGCGLFNIFLNLFQVVRHYFFPETEMLSGSFDLLIELLPWLIILLFFSEINYLFSLILSKIL